MEMFALERQHGGAGGVTSWRGRTGAVEPLPGDYEAPDVGAEPVGAVAVHVADVATHPHLLRRSEAGAAGGIAQLGTDGLLLETQNGGVRSFGGRRGNVTPLPGDYSAADVGADAVGSAASERASHELDAYAHPHYLTRSMTDALYVAAGTPGQGQAAGMTWFSLSGMPRLVAAGEEFSIAHSDVQNCRVMTSVWLREAGAQDVTQLAIDFDLGDAGLYVAQDLAKTWMDGSLRLRQEDPGAVFAVNYGTSPLDVYGAAGVTREGASIIAGVGLECDGVAACVTYADQTAFSLGTSWCLELTLLPTAIPNGRVGLVAQSDGGGYRPKFYLWLLSGSGGAQLGFHTNGPGYPTYDVVTDPFSLALNTTHHIVFQRVGPLIEIFVDGVRRTFNGGAPHFHYGLYAWPDSSQPLCIGCAYDSWPGFVHGLAGILKSVRLRLGPYFYSDNYALPSAPYPPANYDTAPSGWFVKTGPALRLELSMVEQLDYVEATVSEPQGTQVRFLLSFDQGVTWVSDVGQGFVPVNADDALTQGMSAAQMMTSTTSLDVTGYSSIDFLICLSTNNSNVTPRVDGIAVRYDERASYAPATMGRYGGSADFGVRHWSRITKFKNQTGAAQTIIAYVLRGG